MKLLLIPGDLFKSRETWKTQPWCTGHICPKTPSNSTTEDDEKEIEKLLQQPRDSSKDVKKPKAKAKAKAQPKTKAKASSSHIAPKSTGKKPAAKKTTEVQATDADIEPPAAVENHTVNTTNRYKVYVSTAYHTAYKKVFKECGDVSKAKAAAREEYQKAKREFNEM